MQLRCLMPAASMQLRCLMLAAVVFFAWYTWCWMAWMSSSDLPLRPNLRTVDNLPKTAPRYQRKEEITLQTTVTNNTPHPTLYANIDDDVIDFRSDNDDIPVNGSEVIPSVMIDESGHLKLLQTKNEVHSLQETLHERSIEAKDLLSQMIHNAVAPAPVERHDPHPNPTNRSCETNDAFTGIPIDDGNGKPWQPPKYNTRSHKESMKKWDNEYHAAMSRIKQLSNVGGNELRELAKTEVKHLKELRHELFCGAN
jgi:hypothetical protein